MISFVSIKILITLMDGRLHSSSSLSYENEVSTKTIARAIDTLLEAGISVESKLGRYGGYYLSPTSIPQLLGVDEKKLSQILSVAEHTKSILKTQTTPLEETIINSMPKNKIKNVLELSSKIILDNTPWGNEMQDNTNFDKVYEACINKNNIEFDYIDYKNKLSHRVFSPYCTMLKNGIWYSYGICNESNKFKLFKLSRMSNIIESKTNFIEMQIDLNSKPWNKMENFKETNITVEFQSNLYDEIKEWLPITTIKEKDSKITATARVTENDNLYNKLIEDSLKIKLLSPESMVSKLLDKCKTIENIYA